MKRFLILIPFLILFTSVFSQSNQTVRGIVLDSDTRTPLPGATVIIEKGESIMGAYSGDEGEFMIENVPVGRIGIRVRYLGYEETYLSNIAVSSGRQVVLEIEMQEKFVLGDTVSIVASRRTETRNELLSVSARPFTIEETARYAGARNDPARMASSFAGVTGASDQRNDIIIRGNSPTGVLWRMEGIDIANPNHFSTFGTTGGPASALNNNTLANSDFLTGAFPAEYGNALAGVFDLRMRKGNNKKHQFIGQIGINGIEFLAEGPFSKKKKHSYLLSYRYSDLRLFEKLGIDFGSSSSPKFQDINMKLNFPTEKAGVFSVFSLAGISSVEVLDKDREEDDFFGPGGTDLVFDSKILNSGIGHMLPLSEDSYLKSTLYYSYSAMNTILDSVFRDLNETHPFYRNPSAQHKIGLMSSYTKKLNSRNTIKAGVFVDHFMFSLSDTVFFRVTDTFLVPTNFDGKSQLIQPYAHWKYRISEKLTLNTGLHFQYFTQNNSKSLEPRLGLQWQFGKGNQLSLGGGLHSQMQPIFVYFAQRKSLSGESYLPNENLNFTKSIHSVLSYGKTFGKDFKIRAEAYHQFIYNAGVEKLERNSFSLMNQGADFWFVVPDSLENTGKGKNYGLELTVEKFLSKNYYFLFTASLYDAKYTGSDGVWRNSAFNGHFAANALGGYDLYFGKNKNLVFGVNAKTTMAGGKRYTPYDSVASVGTVQGVLIDSLAYSEQFAPYFRTDIRVSLGLNHKRFSHELAFDVSNVFNTQNVMFQMYDPEKNDIRKIYQLGFFPVFQYRIEF